MSPFHENGEMIWLVVSTQFRTEKPLRTFLELL